MTKRTTRKSKLYGHWDLLSWKQRGRLIGYAVQKNWNAYWKYKWVCLNLCNNDKVQTRYGSSSI